MQVTTDIQVPTDIVENVKILVVDDVPDNLRLLSKMLEGHQYKVFKSLTGNMALQIVERNPPDLILLDINMPEMNGYEVCQQLKMSDRTVHIPVIFISALDQVQDKLRAFELGGQDYITKPFQELEVLARVKNQLLIQQQKQQLQDINKTLEQKVLNRTQDLQQVLDFELALKRISDQVRDSLDQHQILQKAVETLADILDLSCCDTALYSDDHTTSTIRYQWVKPGTDITHGQVLYMSDFPEVYEQLQAGIYFAFCQTKASPLRNHSAILACPIFDDQFEQTGTLGDLWLFRETHAGFSELEIRLVQQVANQCAIALRQARLYEAAQAQVKELEHLNQLKDDFLSTVSHELRTPLSNMKTTLKLLTSLTQPEQGTVLDLLVSVYGNKITQYFSILQEECDRELNLVDDLLHLQHIEAGTYGSEPILINLRNLVFSLLEPFDYRTRNQNQTLRVNIAPDFPALHIDTKSLNRIIIELLNNACKYTPEGETIEISLRLIQRKSPSPAQRFLELAVTNTGVEIGAEEALRIFDRFYRIPNNDPWKYGGTGLGLALIKKLVESMDGTIAVASANNQTCFTVRLKTT